MNKFNFEKEIVVRFRCKSPYNKECKGFVIDKFDHCGFYSVADGWCYNRILTNEYKDDE